MSSRRILLVAHHCNPKWSGEPENAWSWTQALEQQTPIELVTHIRNRDAIQQHGLSSPVHYVDTERLAKRVSRWSDRLGGAQNLTKRMLLDTICQLAFDRHACSIAQRSVESNAVDAILRISPTSPRYRTSLWRVGVPFVLGPVNGGLDVARGFASLDGAQQTRWRALHGLAGLLDPFANTLRRASLVVAANERTERLVRRRGADRVVQISERGIWPEQVPERAHGSSERLRAAFAGGPDAQQALAPLVHAVAAASRRVTLDVFGAGEARRPLQHMAVELGVGGLVRFRDAAIDPADWAWAAGYDVLCRTADQDPHDPAALGAAASGLPSVIFGAGAQQGLVAESAGFRVAAQEPETLADLLRDALVQLAESPTRRGNMGSAARSYALEQCAWPQKARRLLDAIADCLESSQLGARHAS